mmetsp:Transcript_21475/g.35561  ORF Transcript_21475/g.35561 Transcript_21475/m.35561 type:complete len:94 (-) Transcript_21475:58-339(-)
MPYLIFRRCGPTANKRTRWLLLLSLDITFHLLEDAARILGFAKLRRIQQRLHRIQKKYSKCPSRRLILPVPPRNSSPRQNPTCDVFYSAWLIC